MPELLIERRMSDRAFIGNYVTAIVLGVLIAAICFATTFLIVAPLALLPLAVVFVSSRLARLNSCYRLFPDRLEVESGILNRKIENVELFRVRDVGLRQGLLGRLANVGDVYVHSTDSSTPDLHVKGVDNPSEFYQQMRQLVSDSRAQHRTMIVEEGTATPEH
jgi:membrane protein YdbS with pleckstrin-like domain